MSVKSPHIHELIIYVWTQFLLSEGQTVAWKLVKILDNNASLWYSLL